MKKAVISLGASQYIVSENETIKVSIAKTDKSTLSVPALAVIDGEKTIVGTPEVKDSKVELKVVNQDLKADKVTAIRFKAKKRVTKVRGHKQQLTELTVTKIS